VPAGSGEENQGLGLGLGRSVAVVLFQKILILDSRFLILEYNQTMRLLPAILIAFNIFDFVPRPPAQEQVPNYFYTEQGKGVLTATVGLTQLIGSVPRGATHVPLLNFNLSADCSQDITVESVTLTHVGLGRTSDIDGVYLSDGNRRLTRAQKFDQRSSDAVLRFSPLLQISKCEAVPVQVLVDFSPDADVASEHGIKLDRASDIQSTAKSIVLSVGDATRRAITTPGQAGTITVNFLPIYGRLRFGRIETVARLQITADNKASHLLKKLTLKNQGDARDMNLTEMTLQTRSGTVLTAIAHHLTGTKVTLIFSPSYILRRGERLLLLLKAQVNINPQHKVDFYLEEPSDLESGIYQGL